MARNQQRDWILSHSPNALLTALLTALELVWITDFSCAVRFS